MIAMIVAHDPNYLIGKDDWMPWNIPQDLALFKQITLNQKIVMGRKTMETLKKPLPKRFTYILTKNKNYVYDNENVQVVYDVQYLLDKYQHSEETLFVCGGSEIYKLFLPYVDTIYASVVKKVYDGDTYIEDYTKRGFVEELVNEYEEFEFKIFQRES